MLSHDIDKLLPVVGIRKLDKVDEDHTRKISEDHLGHDLLCRLQIDLTVGLLRNFSFLKAAAVHIDADKCLRLLDDQIRPAFQPDLLCEKSVDIPAKLIEHRKAQRAAGVTDFFIFVRKTFELFCGQRNIRI